MKKNNPQQKLLRIEHEWLELHVRAYLKDGLAYTIRLMDGTEIHEAVFHFDAVFEKYHFFKVGINCTYPIRDVYCHSLQGQNARTRPNAAGLPILPPVAQILRRQENHRVLSRLRTADLKPLIQNPEIMVHIPQNTRIVSMKEIVEIVTRLGAEGGGAINVNGKWKGKPRTVCIEQLVWCKTSVCLVGGYGNEVSSLSPRDVPFVLNCVLGNYLDDDTKLSVMQI